MSSGRRQSNAERGGTCKPRAARAPAVADAWREAISSPQPAERSACGTRAERPREVGHTKTLMAALQRRALVRRSSPAGDAASEDHVEGGRARRDAQAAARAVSKGSRQPPRDPSGLARTDADTLHVVRADHAYTATARRRRRSCIAPEGKRRAAPGLRAKKARRPSIRQQHDDGGRGA